MTLDQIRDIVSSITQTHRPGVNLTPELFSTLINAASIKHFKRRIGLPEQYQPGAPFPPQVAEVSIKESIDLKPFLVYADQHSSPIIFINGRASYPKAFAYPLSASHLYYSSFASSDYERAFDIVNEKQWAERVHSVNESPDVIFPIMRFGPDFIAIYPESIQIVRMVYYRWPAPAEYRLRVQNGVNVYDVDASVELEWDEANQVDIAAILLSDIGVAVAREDIVQIAEKTKNVGI